MNSLAILRFKFLILLPLLVTGLFGCASEPIAIDKAGLGAAADSPALQHPGTLLAPQASFYTGNNPAVIRHLEPGKAGARAGMQPGDLLVRLNGKKFLSAATFERELKNSPRNASITLKRGDAFKMIPVQLDEENPRLGVSFEPEGVALRKQTSPFIAYERVQDLTVYVESSLNDITKELHVNFIMRSSKTLPIARMNYSISEVGQPHPLGVGFERLDALGSNPHLLRKVFKTDGALKGPLLVSFNIDRRHFQFEFK